LLLAPTYTVYKVRSRNVAGHTESIEYVSRATLYEVNGLRVVVILIIFALLFSSIGALATRGRYIALAVLSLLATTLTIMAMLTIGIHYFPAVVAVAAGWILLGLERVFRAKDYYYS
jgi:hypothetical protein